MERKDVPDISLVQLECPDCGYQMDVLNKVDGKVVVKDKEIEGLRCPNCEDSTLVRL